ncbi:MAG TPA: DNA-3-methyladenine glycosylase [Bacteroidia bacterium]|jgi:DNA-3-methyladenine glycosylase|nr:DNA-3-methyladenine glycosylase [Bacteroidia bacterium]
MPKLKRYYYQQENVVAVARDLLGKTLCTRINGKLTTGIITETEAYAGTNDKASHSFGGKRTARNEVMYAKGGRGYVYLCYGLHHLFNVVTNKENIPHAVLIRSLKPLEGIETILKRRRHKAVAKNTSGGPGTVSQALGISTELNGEDLTGNKIWLQEEGIKIIKQNIIAGPRVGVDYAGEDAELPYRFILKTF